MSVQKLNLRTFLNLAHIVLTKPKSTGNNKSGVSVNKKDRKKDSSWGSKYHSVFKNVTDATRKSSNSPINVM